MAGVSGGDTLCEEVWIMDDRVFCTVKKQAVRSKDIYGVHSIHEAGFNMDAGAAPVLCKWA